MNELESWDNFTAENFLKAGHVKTESDFFIVVAVNLYERDDKPNEKPRIRLQLEKDKVEYTFDLNKTNALFCKENKIAKPKDLLGKRLYFKKVLARDPNLNKEVDSLRISKIE